MKKIFFLFIITSCLIAQTKLSIDIDYSRFRFDDSTGYLEIYYVFRQDELKHVKIDRKWIVNGIINAIIKEKKTGKLIVNKSWQISNDIDTTKISLNKNLNGVISFQLGFNDYTCCIFAKDVNNISMSDSLQFDVKIEPQPANRFSVSDIQLSSEIKKSDGEPPSIFQKNHYEVVPNPKLLYGKNLPVLYFYSEFYNINNSCRSEFIKITYFVCNYYDKNIIEKSKFVSSQNQSFVDVGAINITKLPSGVYKLKIELKDSLTNIITFSEKKFYIYNPTVVDTNYYTSQSYKFLPTEFSLMENEELENNFAFAHYIASIVEINEWKKLNTKVSKQQYLAKFWEDKNKLYSIDGSNFQSEYFKRIEIANERFSTFQKKGWKTDRGRIYIIYGEPSEIEKNLSQADKKPYLIWHYENLEGGVIFVFAELEGFGDYTLIHSTKRGELSDGNWQRKVNSE
jgi:GWxTD domain-containing protein